MKPSQASKEENEKEEKIKLMEKEVEKQGV